GTLASGYDAGNFVITPLHGLGFYVDLKNGFNASYIGYRVKNEGAAATGLWLEVGNFRDGSDNASSVLSLANPADAYMPIGSLASGATKVVYFLVKASDVSSSTQRHDAILHLGYPNGTSSIADGGQAKCRHNFTKVVRTLAAGANKVTSITVNTPTPVIGDSVVVTVKGSTGKSGSGSTSPDGDIMWLSGASSSLWPTRALRLEKTTLNVKWNKNTPANSQLNVTDILLLDNVSTDADTSSGGNQTFLSATTYTATFTFRVLGGSTTNPSVRPVAQIASGTQVKHTGTYPSLATTITSSSPKINMTSVKTVSSISSDSSTGFWSVTYKVKLTDTATAVTLDSIVDDPDTSVTYVSGSAKIIDASRSDTFTSITDPKSETSTVDNYKYTFGGPFSGKKVGSNYEIELMYTMQVPVTLVSTNPEVFNRAFGMIGSTLVGSSSNKVSMSKLTLDPNGATPIPTNGLEESKPPQPQIIEFPQPVDGGVGQSINLAAVATSGLTVTYTSSSPAVCTVSGSVVTYVGEGTCTLRASQSGNDDWLSATPVEVSITIKPGQTITFNPNSPMAVADTQVVSVTASSGLNVTVEVVSTEVCALNSAKDSFSTVAIGGSIGIYPRTAGQCVLVATQSGDTTYGPAPSVERIVNIGNLQYIDFPALIDRTASSGTRVTVTATAKNSSTNSPSMLLVTFVSATPEVCDVTSDSTMDGSGVSTASYEWYKNGICIFVASQDGLDDGAQSTYAPAADVSRSFKIGDTTPSILVIPSSLEVTSESNFTATVRVTVPDNGTLAGTLTLFASGRVVSTDEIQQAGKSAALSTGNSTDESFTLTAGILSVGAPNEQIALAASFTTSNSDFTSTSTESDTFVAVVAPLAPQALTSDVPEGDVESTTATLRGTFNPQSSNSTSVSVFVGDSSASLSSSGVTITSPGTACGTGT
ncbi:MAG: hypothetical protein ACO3P3_06325, partial [Candidatus Nanopelagicales bacterium]